MISKLKLPIDRFVLLIGISILIAYFIPEGGADDFIIPLNLITSIGISVIFFLYGLKLSPDKLRLGLKNWRLHVLIQCTTFIIVPLIVLTSLLFINNGTQSQWWIAFFFLACLPSTVSSSVVMISIAKGNIPAGIFNASISGLIGIVLTPLWMGFFLQNQESLSFDFTTIYIKLLLEILLPVLIGFLLQKHFRHLIEKHGAWLTFFDKTIILLIVYKSFAESFLNDIFAPITTLELSLITIGVIILFWIVYSITYYISKALNFNREDTITALFCGSKKSLVHGTVFSKILFNHSSMVGIYLLPLMLFHAIQLLIVSHLAERMRKAYTK